ncbi:hypothetical protein K491DRAFT_692505 [Lophiostoma macrostomum CBS 122681]|uniref:Uncharacterized protein n=1 Tax=Lophiostoma macrostomum CBS 122681 TaxID=1314788 RepID=A0A6A6T771_9PLEO|nr:hypothetical protein K491DRAFT_692505 [Lophiostoma macrostomum CBS 122681]
MLQRRIASNASCAARAVRRPVPRTANARFRTQTPRFQSSSSTSGSSSSNSTSNSGSTLSPAIVGGLSGSLATFAIGYYWYRQSGARDLVQATKQTKAYAQSATQKLKESTPEPNEALKWLRSTAQSYAAFIPGARGYVDSAFDDIDAIREKHGDEVDNIVREAYEELRGIAKDGQLSLITAEKAWNVIVNQLGRIGDLAGDAAQQIMDNHPQLKDKVGGNLDSLKEMGQNFGPEAKKEVDRTWDQISDVVKTGMSAENIEKVRKIVQEKVDKLKQLGDEAWKKGMEQAKPYLDKNPKVKEIIEENADSLKSGNVQDLFKKIKKAVESGDTGDLESYVSSFADKAKKSGFGGLDQYLNKVPGGDQIIPKFQQIQQVAEKHGDEAQRIMKDAVTEISEILKKKGDEAANLAKKAKDESKK